MARHLTIISQSSMDLASTLDQYERYRAETDVLVLVMGTEQNYQYLSSLDLPDGSLRFVQFPSRAYDRKKNILGYWRRLREDRRALDLLADEIAAFPDSDVVFHSDQNDIYTSYLVVRLQRDCQVALIDVLAMRPERLAARKLLTVPGLKTLVSLALLRPVFGNILKLTGTKQHPRLSLKIENFAIDIRPEDTGAAIGRLQAYRYRLPADRSNVLLLYGGDFVFTAGLTDGYRAMVECILAKGFRLVLKVHPQGALPTFVDDTEAEFIPKYVPFELVDLTSVALVVGMVSASLLHTGEVPTVSLLDMAFDPQAEFYQAAMGQLSKNPQIMFIESVEAFNEMMSAL